MSDIARLFSESFNRTMAEMNERDRFEKQMAFQEKESAANEAFKKLQIQNMMKELEIKQTEAKYARSYQQAMLNETMLNNFEGRFARVSVDEAKRAGLAGLSQGDVERYAGELHPDLQGYGQDFVYVGGPEYSAYRQNLNETQKLRNMMAMQDQKDNAKFQEGLRIMQILDSMKNTAYGIEPEITVNYSIDKPITVSPLETLLSIGMIRSRTQRVTGQEQQFNPNYIEQVAGIINQMRPLVQYAGQKQLGINAQGTLEPLEQTWFENVMQNFNKIGSVSPMAKSLFSELSKRNAAYQNEQQRNNALNAMKYLSTLKLLGEIQGGDLPDELKGQAQSIFQTLQP